MCDINAAVSCVLFIKLFVVNVMLNVSTAILIFAVYAKGTLNSKLFNLSQACSTVAGFSFLTAVYHTSHTRILCTINRASSLLIEDILTILRARFETFACLDNAASCRFNWRSLNRRKLRGESRLENE